MTERRRFSRILYQAPAQITHNGHSIATTVHDLSLHGVLLTVIDKDIFECGEEVRVDLTLPDSNIVIQMFTQIVSKDGDNLRMCIKHIDIDSIAHLRRLVELNVGDDALLYREIEHLANLSDELNQ